MTRPVFRRMTAIAVLLVALGGASWVSVSWALGLQEAKSQGLVGEQSDGYLGAVKGGGSEVKGLIDDINSKRKQTYRDIAKRNNTSLDAVEALAGKTAIEKTPSGQFIRLPSGDWVKK